MRDGRYQVTFCYTHPLSKERQRFRRKSPFTSKRKAQRWMAERIAEYESRAFWQRKLEQEQQDKIPKVADFVNEFLNGTDVRPSTKDIYKSRLINHIVPQIGDLRLDEVTTADTDELFETMRNADLAVSTIKGAATALGSMLSYAVSRDLISKGDRPTLTTPTLPARLTQEVRYLEDDEVERLLEAAGEGSTHVRAGSPHRTACGRTAGTAVGAHRLGAAAPDREGHLDTAGHWSNQVGEAPHATVDLGSPRTARGSSRFKVEHARHVGVLVREGASRYDRPATQSCRYCLPQRQVGWSEAWIACFAAHGCRAPGHWRNVTTKAAGVTWARFDHHDRKISKSDARCDGCHETRDGGAWTPWRASGSAASGVHTFAHALVRGAVSLEALAPPAEVAGAVAVDGGTLVMDSSGRVVLLQDHPVWGQRHRIPAPFNSKLIRGACHWGAFLDSIFEGAEDRKATLQEYVGATLFGIADALQRVLLVLGEGSNGKGVLMRAIKRLFPEDAVCSIPPQLMRGGSNAGLHTLLDARLNLCGDVDREALLETGLLKQLTGGDRVSFDVKYAPERRSGVATCGHIWSLNRLPATRDQSTGFWRRWAIVPFEQTFTGREDFNLNDKLKTDLPVILAWAVEGAQRLVRNGMVLTMGASHDDAISEWKGETDSGRAFAEVARRPNERETITKVYQAYTAWCERSGRKALSRPHLRDRLDALAKEGAIERVNLSGTIHYGLTASIWESEEPEVEAEAEPAPPLDFITLLDATTTH